MSAEVPADVHVTYAQQYRRCGKRACRQCRTGPGHGPYWYAYWREGGRRHSRYLGKQIPAGAVPPAHDGASPVPIVGGDSAALRVRALGGFEVWRGDRGIPSSAWNRQKVAALFKCLLGAPGHRLHRQQAMEALWPHAAPEAARRNLRYTLHLLRRLLDDPGGESSAIRDDDGVLTLQPWPPGSALWLDADRFVEAAAVALAGRDAAACRAALALYTGEYLPDDRYMDWAAARRDTLRGRRHDLLMHLAALRAEADDTAEAERCLRAVLVEDRCHEAAAIRLMELLAAGGREAEALRVYQALASALRGELDIAPGGAAVALRARLLSRPTNLPTALTSFVGRGRERDRVAQLLTASPSERGARLVTLTGIGGCGKTRLALEVGAVLLPHYAAGVWLVDLASVRDPAHVSQAIAEALAIQEQPDQPLIAVIIEALRDRQLLLVLDNCEHLAGACATVAGALLRAAAHVRILATSREVLGIDGEATWPVPPLSLPAIPAPGGHGARPNAAGEMHAEVQGDALAAIARSEAVRLFVQRARARRPDFSPHRAQAGLLAEICRRLDGLPLAIELAAARLGALSLEELLARLDDRFSLLTGGASVARQRTMHAAMDWSYSLLAEPERILLRRLAVFVGGWSARDAEAICPDPAAFASGADRLEPSTMLDQIASLIDKSLVVREERHGATWYRLIETVREYGLERLAAADEEEAVRARHLAWYVVLARQAEQALRGPEQKTWLGRLDAGHDNLRQALHWALSGDRNGARAAAGLALAGCLWRYWWLRGHFGEGAGWLERALEHAPSAPGSVRAMALGGLGNLSWAQGSYERAAAAHAASLQGYSAMGNRQGSADALNSLGLIAHDQGEFGRARALFEESLALKQDLGDVAGITVSLTNLGTVLLAQGEYEQAETIYERALALKRTLLDSEGTAILLTNLGALAHDRGDLGRAATLHREALAIYQDLGDAQGAAGALGNLGELAYDQGEIEQATALLERSLALHRELGDQLGIAVVLNDLGAVASRMGDHVRAHALHLESLLLHHRLAARRGVLYSVLGLAEVAAGRGRPRLAAWLLGVADGLREAVGTVLPQRERARYEQALRACREQLRESAFQALWARGRGAQVEEAIRRAARAQGADASRPRHAG